jgi:hypothetical protein
VEKPVSDGDVHRPNGSERLQFDYRANRPFRREAVEFEALYEGSSILPTYIPPREFEITTEPVQPG